MYEKQAAHRVAVQIPYFELPIPEPPRGSQPEAKHLAMRALVLRSTWAARAC